MGCFQGENGLSPLSILSTSHNACLHKIFFSRCEAKALHSTDCNRYFIIPLNPTLSYIYGFDDQIISGNFALSNLL